MHRRTTILSLLACLSAGGCGTDAYPKAATATEAKSAVCHVTGEPIPSVGPENKLVIEGVLYFVKDQAAAEKLRKQIEDQQKR